MDTISLFYFTESAKDLNFTRTAKRLFISQQNLSNHIARLEEYFGVKLFERKPHLSLTYSGNVLLNYSKNFVLEEENLKNKLADIEKYNKGTLDIGASTIRASIFLPKCIKRFTERFPNVSINLHDHPSSKLEQMVLAGDLDFAIGIIHSNNQNLVCKPVLSDKVYLLVSEDLMRKYMGDKTDMIIQQSLTGSNINDFASLPFIFPSSEIRLTKIIQHCFSSANCEPNIFLVTTYPQFFLHISYEGIAASIITQMTYYDIKNNLAPNMKVFPLKIDSEFVLHDITITHNKRKYITKYSQFFMEILTDYFMQLEYDRID